MRMRELGHGQSLVFCAPPKVDRCIRQAENVGSSCLVKVIDILSWVISNTCADLEHHLPHWINQGVDYHKRQRDCTFFASKADVELLKTAWLRSAAQSLDEMYGLTTKSSSNSVHDIPAMRERLDMLGVTDVHDAGLEEEQEREVSREVEQKARQKRPPRVQPAVHHLDDEVRHFVQAGIIHVNSNIFFPLMTPLHSVFRTLGPLNPWSGHLLATRDFMTTTESGEEKSVLTEYLRPINWIVSCLSHGNLVLVAMSPYEVNILLEDIRASKQVRLHMYAPRTTQVMTPFDNLTFYCIPPLPPRNPALISPSLDLRCQLNIWSGQLYLDQYETYLRLCLLLGICSSETEGYSSVESDGFVPEKGRIGVMVDVCLFGQSPLTLLKRLFELRRKGTCYNLTHMGKILHGHLLSREDFE